MNDVTFSDEDLTAYLDGEADDAVVAGIEAALEDASSGMVERLQALDIPLAEMRAVFAQEPLVTMPEGLLPAPQDKVVPFRRPASRTWVSLAGGIAAGFAVAWMSGFAAPRPAAETSWIDAVATYQALYTPETIAAVSTPDTTSLESLSEVLGVDLMPLSQLDGLEFRRAQELGFNGQPLIQIAYALPDGTPVALCLIAREGASGEMISKMRAGMAASSWNNGSHAVLLIGGQDQAVIDAISVQAQSLI